MPIIKVWPKSQKEKDELVYRHFNSAGHRGLEDMSIQLIECVKGEKELREKGVHWIYKLGTLAPYGLNENDGQVLLFETKSVGYAQARANLRIFCSLLSDVTSF